jgi:hypothetical protein
MPVVIKPFCFRIEPIEAAPCADPEDTRSVLDNRQDDIIAQAVRVIRIVLVTRDLLAVTIKFIEPSHRTSPDRPGPVLINDPHGIVAQAVKIVRVVLVPDESILFQVILIETAAPGPKPQYAALVCDQSSDNIMPQAVGIVRIVAVHFYAGAVIPGQSVQCGKPHKAVVILGNAPYLNI